MDKQWLDGRFLVGLELKRELIKRELSAKRNIILPGVGALAFEKTRVDLLFDERIGIILGSLLSGVVGYLVLRVSVNSTST